MTLLDHARTELAIAGRQEDMASEAPIAAAILEIVEGFAGQGHSGGSASIVGPRVAWIVGQLLSFEPITPLTGDAGEWMDVDEVVAGQAGMQQNVRCGRVFRERQPDGTWVAYALDVVAFRSFLPNRGSWTGWDSARRVTFPCYPPRTRVTRLRYPSRWWARLRGQLRP